MRERRRSESGAAAVEFAIIFPLFCALLFGLVQFGFYFWTAETTNSAAREVARRVVVGDCWTSGARTSFASTHTRGLISVSVAPPPSTSLAVGDRITVTVTSDSEIINFIPGIPATVTRSYEARMEVNAPTSPDRCP